jgi:hypothetical protein
MEDIRGAAEAREAVGTETLANAPTGAVLRRPQYLHQASDIEVLISVLTD